MAQTLVNYSFNEKINNVTIEVKFDFLTRSSDESDESKVNVRGLPIIPWDMSTDCFLNDLYLMYFLDFSLMNRIIRVCGNDLCNRLFIPENPNTLYCSKNCSNKHNARKSMRGINRRRRQK
jgi:hypothetical protein